MNDPKFKDRFYGCMYGLAIGDALGMPVEFMERDTFPLVTDYLPNIHWDLEAGSWTDDTSMALCLAQSLIEHGGFSHFDQLHKYWLWYRNGYMSVNGKCFDIGNTTRMALDNFYKTKQVISPYNGSQYSGNGSLMRLAPIPLYFYKTGLGNTELMSGISSKTTHSSPECISACEILGKLLYECFSGVHARDISIPDRIYDMTRREVKSTGYVKDTLDAALWSFAKTNSFEECVLTAVNLGDDADTVGAVAGQIAGAYYGYAAIPERFITGLQRRDLIERITTGLYSSAINM